MKNLAFVFMILLMGHLSLAQEKTEKERIIEVIEKGYVQGLHNKGDLGETAKSFHEGFNLLGKRNGLLNKTPIYNWIQSSKQRREKNPGKPETKTTAKYPQIDITGDAAVAKVELYRNDNLIFTDYLMLYKFDKNWRIVGKIYHRHKE